MRNSCWCFAFGFCEALSHRYELRFKKGDPLFKLSSLFLSADTQFFNDLEYTPVGLVMISVCGLNVPQSKHNDQRCSFFDGASFQDKVQGKAEYDDECIKYMEVAVEIPVQEISTAATRSKSPTSNQKPK
jgi:hypothetical protein